MGDVLFCNISSSTVTFHGIQYNYGDGIQWNPEDEAFEIAFYGQRIGNAEEHIESFINTEINHGVFFNHGNKQYGLGDNIMEPGFIGKIVRVVRIAKRGDPGYDGLSQYILTVRRLIPVDNVPLPPRGGDAYRKWGRVVRALGVARNHLIGGQAKHGIFRVNVAVANDVWQSVTERLVRDP
jgi:hypothetical protein